MSQEECARLRESVPYVKVYRYNPKHLHPKLNGYITLYNGIKVKWSPYRFCVAQRVGRGIDLLFHDRGTRRGEWSAARPCRTLPPGKTRYPFYRRLGGPQGRSGWVENLVRTGIRFRAVQPVVIRYTDWVTGPTMYKHLFSQNFSFDLCVFNPLTPNDHYSGRTAPLTSKRCMLYIHSTNTGAEYFKHRIYFPFFFLFKLQFVS